jgi:alcohol dehydrogenase
MLIAIGGGSPIDTAKGIRIIMNNNVKLEDCSGVEKVDRISTPMIAIPTTAGTGSEVTKFAVLSDLEKDLKFTVTSGLICPDYAILDPQLTIGLPAGITAATGFDALTHAIEALTSIIAQPLTDVISFESIKLIFDWLPKAVNQGTDLEARSEMLKAQLYAGIAFNNAFLGLSHAIASPLGAHCHIPHGLANAVMLSYVVKYNVPAAADKYAKAYDIIKNNVSSEGKYDKGYQFAKEIENLNKLSSLPSKLSEIGVDKKKLDLVAEDALKSGMLKFNVRSADKKQIREILEEAY